MCSIMIRPERYYAKWKKPNTEGQILHVPTYLRHVSKTVRLNKSMNRMVNVKGWKKKGLGNYCSKGIKLGTQDE